MDADVRTAPDALTAAAAPAALAEEPERFAFFQAVRLLERALPAAAPVGGLGPAEEEGVRFRAAATLGFPTADVLALEAGRHAGGDDPLWRMTVSFLGLYGPASPLPPHYTENLLRGGEDEAQNVLDFLDLFNHRFVALFYRAWLKYRHALRYEPGATDEPSRQLLALAGLGDPAVRADDGLDWPRLLPLVGLLALRRRSAATAERILAAYFEGVPVRIEQWVPRRAPVLREQQACLGRHACTLGADTVAGRSVRDLCGRFRVVLGPLDRATFDSFLPGTPRHGALCRLIRLVADDHLTADVALVLDRGEAPEARLGSRVNGRLGLGTWLGPPGADPTVVVSGDDAPPRSH
ncbi:type VI secretion system baseplate subunit TssG [Azospirillum sp. ST 5-10]|uniref:type VI secretion system baseplate subunit TssG n=1 Tax=unclassified Azospirillum TaxID=2630922 RepID=UPI003F49BF05